MVTCIFEKIFVPPFGGGLGSKRITTENCSCNEPFTWRRCRCTWSKPWCPRTRRAWPAHRGGGLYRLLISHTKTQARHNYARRPQGVAGTPAIGPVGVPYGNMAEWSYCSTPFPYDCWLKIVPRLPIASYICTQLFIGTERLQAGSSSHCRTWRSKPI